MAPRPMCNLLSWLILAVASLALLPLVWLVEKLEWLLLSDEERWEREEKEWRD